MGERSRAGAKAKGGDQFLFVNKPELDRAVVAGFSGGAKMVAPGRAGLNTVLVRYDAKHIGSPNAMWGMIDGNPVQDDIREIARTTGVTFSIRRHAESPSGHHRSLCRRAVRRTQTSLHVLEEERYVSGRFSI